MKLLLIRHGQTEGNANKVMEDAHALLSETGYIQAQKVATYLSTEDYDVLLSSPFTRALQTAKEIAETTNKKIDVEDLLQERNADSLIGKNYSDIDWSDLPLDVETRHELFARAEVFLEKIRKQYSQETVVAVSHGGFIRAFLRVALNLPPDSPLRFSIKNTSLTAFKIDEHLELLYLNKTTHLE